MANQNAVLAVQNANSAWGRQLVDGDPQGGHLPLDQMVAIFTQNGGQGGMQGMVNDMNEVGKPMHMTAQDYGVPWDTLMPGLAALYKANPNQMPDVTPNTQNLADIVTNNTASKFLDGSGNFTGSKADWDAAQQAAIDKYHLGAGDRSFGALAKSFLTEGALPPIVAAAFAGGGLDSFLNGGGVPGLGDGGAFDMGGSNGFGGSTPIGAGDATWGVNPHDLSNIPTNIPGDGSSSNIIPNETGDLIQNADGTISPSGTQVGQTIGNTGTNTVIGPAGTAGAGSALSRLLDGTATTADYVSLGGKAGSSILGYLGAENKANALTSVADKNLALGAPYRGMLAASYDPSFSMSNEPGYKDAIDQSMNSYLRKASTGGNPFSNPGVSTEALKYVTAGTALPQLNTYRSQLGTYGQLGLNTAGTAQIGAAGASGGTYDALGYGLGQMTQPDSTLQDLLKKYASGNSPSINFAGIS